MKNQELHPRTAVINKSQKNHSKRARLNALSWLANKFPKAFSNVAAIYPLKAGIMQDILAYADEAAEAGISKSKLREAVVVFTRRVDYLTCLKAREMRIDLEGNIVAQVNEQEADHAANKIKKRVEKSAKNARKNMTIKANNPSNPSLRSNNTSSRFLPQITEKDESFVPVYPPRAQMHTAQSAQPARAESVVVKRKVTRPYDPNAVARLKEKLGISRKLEEELLDS